MVTTTADKKDAEATQEKKRGLRPKKTVEADVVNVDEKEAVAAIVNGEWNDLRG